MLTHTSGLSLSAAPSTNPQTDRPPAAMPVQVSSRGRTAVRPEVDRGRIVEAVERAAGSPVAFQPGERWQYGSSTDFVAALVEKISRIEHGRFPEDADLQPLGIRDSHYFIPQRKTVARRQRLSSRS